MYQKKAFNRREQDYAMALRRKLEEAETMIQNLAPSRSRSLALTKLDEALLWANVGIAEAGLQQGYTAAPRNRGFDFDDALATNVDGQQVRATRARDITFDGMKITPDSVENHSALKSGLDTIDHQKLTDIVEAAAQKEAAMGDDFCAFTFLFPLANGYFGVKTRDYITSYTLSQLPASRRQQYEEFMREGTLFVFDGTVLDMMQVYDDLDNFIMENEYDVRAFGYDPYNAQEFVKRWGDENSTFGVVKVIQGAKTESVPLGELKKLSEQRKLLFDEQLMQFAMGNCITLADTNGNRKLYKQRQDQKIDAVAAMMDAYVAWKKNRDAFE